MGSQGLLVVLDASYNWFQVSVFRCQAFGGLFQAIAT